MRSLVPGYHLGNKNEKSKDYCKPDSEQRVLFFHNKISGGHTSLLQVYKCYCSSTVLVQVYKCYLGNTIVYRQCWKERFKIYKATKFENCKFQTTSQSGEILPRFVFSRQTCEVIYCCSSAYSARPMRFGSRGACTRSYGKRRLISTQAKRSEELSYASLILRFNRPPLGLFNNYSSSPNGFLVNSSWGRRPNGLLTQRPWGREE